MEIISLWSRLFTRKRKEIPLYEGTLIDESNVSVKDEFRLQLVLKDVDLCKRSFGTIIDMRKEAPPVRVRITRI